MKTALLTRRRGGSALGRFAANGLRPNVVRDFDAGFWANSGAPASIPVTGELTGLATTVDSDGLIKWVPHNLLTHSEDFSNADWVKSDSASVTANQAIAPNGGLEADLIDLSGSDTARVVQGAFGTTFSKTAGVWLRSVSGTGTFPIGYFEQGGDYVNTLVTLAETWQFFDLSIPTIGTNFGFSKRPLGTNPSLGAAYVWGAHAYRSDLGGMQAVPVYERGLASSSTYLPTTSAARYLSRLNDYVGSTKYALAEPAATNLVTYSEDFTDASWPKIGSSVSGGAAISPDGQTNATKLIPNNTTTNGYVSRSQSVTVQVYTISFFAKAAEESRISMVSNLTGTFRAIVFDLATETATPSTNWVAQIEDVGNGWYRCIATATAQSATSYVFQVGNNSTGWAGDGSSGVYIYGAQLEAGSIPTSYIPTSGATAIRTVDALHIPYTAFDWPSGGSPAVSIAMEGLVTYADTGSYVEARPHRWGASSNAIISSILNTFGANTGVIDFEQASGAVVDYSSSSNIYNPGINVPFNIASRHGSNFINGAVDGTALTVNTTPVALPDLSTTNIQLAPTGVVRIKSIRLWSEDIGDTGIEEASA